MNFNTPSLPVGCAMALPTSLLVYSSNQSVNLAGLTTFNAILIPLAYDLFISMHCQATNKNFFICFIIVCAIALTILIIFKVLTFYVSF